MKCPKCCSEIEQIIAGASRSMYECKNCGLTMWI